MDLGDMLDCEAISRMDDAQFGDYWAAVGTAVRIASRARTPAGPAEPAEPERKEINNTAVSAERRWAPHVTTPAAAIGFGRQA